MTKKRLVLAAIGAMVAILLGGCAVVSNTRRQEGGSEKHVFSVLCIPVWVSETPIEETSRDK